VADCTSKNETFGAGAPEPSDVADPYVIAVLGKAFHLIDAIAEQDGLTMSDLGAATGLNRPTTLRILKNLVTHEYAHRDQNGRYHLGVRLLQLGSAALANIDLRSTARPLLEALRNEVDETINLAFLA